MNIPDIKKAIFSIFLISSIFNELNSQIKHSTGLLFNADKYSKLEIQSPALKFNELERDSYSLKKYCPTPGDQGQMGSCTSWATGYAALTISQAIAENNTDTRDITKKAKSALYIYNQIRKGSCEEGTYIEDAIELVQKKGDCDLKDFNPDNCRIIPTRIEDIKADLFKIKEHNRLWDIDASYTQKILATINSLNSNKPVIISLSVKKSIHEVSTDGEYLPKGNFNINDPGHALCVIGYDNINKKFEIINSWGTTWGDNGFFKISYEDFGKFSVGGYQFSISYKDMHKQPIQGRFQLLKLQNENNSFSTISPYFGSDKFYHISSKIKLNDFFRLRAQNLTKDSYVYIFSYKPKKTAEILFPLHYNSNNSFVDIPLIASSKATIELPENLENAYSADQTGEDILGIFYTNKRIINLDKLIKEIPNYNGDIWTWFNTNFKNELIDPSFINYNTFEMGISTDEGFKGSIAPLFLKVTVQ